MLRFEAGWARARTAGEGLRQVGRVGAEAARMMMHVTRLIVVAEVVADTVVEWLVGFLLRKTSQLIVRGEVLAWTGPVWAAGTS